MRILNGSIGGGQVLRTALGLSCLLNKSFHIFNIRKSRSNPGLQEQHLQCVLALAKISNAELKGAYKGSTELYFSPKEVKNTNLDIKISTAGSIGLVLQSLLIVGFKFPLDIKISGGATYGKWAPSIDFINKVFCFWLRKLGMKIDIKVLKHGFYPKGAAEVEVKVFPAKADEKINIENLGEAKKIHIIGVSSKALQKRNVLERMSDAIIKEIYKKYPFKITTQLDYVDAVCDGCGVTIYAEKEYGVVGSSICGEVGKTSEEVAKEISQIFLEDISKDALDRYTSDQIIPYLGLLGGKVKVASLTEHLKSNIEVVEKFLEKKFKKYNNFIYLLF